jgi:YD repeat-containing protein
VIPGTYLSPVNVGTAARFSFGNTGTGIQYASGGQMKIYSYGSLVLSGLTSNVAPPSFNDVGGDAQVIVSSTNTDDDVFVIRAMAGQTGHLQKWVGPLGQMYGYVDWEGNFVSLSTTSSTSSTTGAIVSHGGVGVGENLYVGGKFGFDAGAYATEIDNDPWMAAESNEKLVTQYAAKNYADFPHAATKDPTGFEFPASVTLSYDAANRQMTITQAGGIIIWRNGQRLVLDSPYVTAAHSASNGVYYLAIKEGDADVPTWHSTVWAFSDVQISLVYYYPGTLTMALRECHGLMPWQVHDELHRVIGAYKKSGGLPTAGTYTVQPASPTDADNIPGFDAAIMADEDLDTSISAWPQGTYTNVWFTGSGDVNINSVATVPFNVGTTYPLFYSYSGGVFTPTEISSQDFTNFYQVLIPATSDTDSQKFRMIMIQPQFRYYTLTAALDEDFNSLYLGPLAAVTTEFVAVTKFTLYAKSNYASTGRCRIEAVSYLTGTSTQYITVSGFTPSSHTTLLDKDVFGEHPAAAISINTPSNNLLNSTSLQEALTKIDGMTEFRAIDKTITYDGQGRVSVVTDAQGTKTMGYDGGGKLVSITGTGVYQNKTFVYTGGQLTSITVS